ncbi:MAG: hypothetical protein H7336_14930 [Bacteriovorax sp.]|nr:hypothetical protein [Bacteriovorax sp.]
MKKFHIEYSNNLDNNFLKTHATLPTRDKYLASVGHDLKNPLTAISLSAGLIKRSYLKKSTDHESFINYIDVIERNIGKMKRLVDDLLDV